MVESATPTTSPTSVGRGGGGEREVVEEGGREREKGGTKGTIKGGRWRGKREIEEGVGGGRERG